MPLVATAEVRRRDVRDNWFVLGRLHDGITVEHARAEMTAIGRRLGAAYPATNQGRNLMPLVSTFEDFFIGAGAGAVYRAMWGAVAFVLLIACANLANLLLARARLRSREICVRMAIGAGRWRVVRQLLDREPDVVGNGGLVGWWIARWGVAAYAAAANGSGISEETFGVWFIDVLDYSMDYRAFAYLAAISVGTALVFGLLPALRLSNARRERRPEGWRPRHHVGCARQARVMGAGRGGNDAGRRAGCRGGRAAAQFSRHLPGRPRVRCRECDEHADQSAAIEVRRRRGATRVLRPADRAPRGRPRYRPHCHRVRTAGVESCPTILRHRGDVGVRSAAAAGRRGTGHWRRLLRHPGCSTDRRPRFPDHR